MIEPLKQVLRHRAALEVVWPKPCIFVAGISHYGKPQAVGKYKRLVWTPMTIRGTQKARDAAGAQIEIKV